VGNVYIILKQIYSGNGVPNLIRIARVLYEILQKKRFGLFFLGQSVYISVGPVIIQNLNKLLAGNAWRKPVNSSQKLPPQWRSELVAQWTCCMWRVHFSATCPSIHLSVYLSVCHTRHPLLKAFCTLR